MSEHVVSLQDTKCAYCWINKWVNQRSDAWINVICRTHQKLPLWDNSVGAFRKENKYDSNNNKIERKISKSTEHLKENNAYKHGWKRPAISVNNAPLGGSLLFESRQYIWQYGYWLYQIHITVCGLLHLTPIPVCLRSSCNYVLQAKCFRLLFN